MRVVAVFLSKNFIKKYQIPLKSIKKRESELVRLKLSCSDLRYNRQEDKQKGLGCRLIKTKKHGKIIYYVTLKPRPMDPDRPKRKFVIIKRCFLYELAEVYECSLYEMRNLLKPHEEKIGKKKGRFKIEQVELILKLVKLPPHVRVIT